VLEKADLIGDGVINKFEVKLALGLWFQRRVEMELAKEADLEAEEMHSKNGADGSAPMETKKSKACTLL